jgi:hypothetical protein
MIDEMDDLYETVGLELKRGEERPGFMARATAEADGNPEKVRSLYIRYRVAELAGKRQREADKTARDEGARKVDSLTRIQDLLKQPHLSMHSCEQILTLAGFKVSTEIPERWMVKEKTGAIQVLYSAEDFIRYTVRIANSILASSNFNLSESPHALSDAPFQSFFALAQTTNSASKFTSRQSATYSETKTHEQPAFAEPAKSPILLMAKKSASVVLIVLGTDAAFSPIRTIILQAAMVLTGLWALISGKIWLVADRYTVKSSTARIIGALLVSAAPLSFLGAVAAANIYGDTNSETKYGALIELGIFLTIAVVAYAIYRMSRQAK